ncbi:MAG: DUF1573 domain-containing protein [Candidatus Zixiibacteriota bacterium]
MTIMIKLIQQFIISILIMSAISAVCLASGENRPHISAVNANHDFGFIPIDYDFIHYFHVANIGKADLKIEKMIPNCDCTTASTNDTLLKPGDTADILIHFNTLNYYGPTTRHVTVYSNDPDHPTILLNYSSNIGFFPELFNINPIALFFLPGHKDKQINLINKYNKNVDFSIELEQDSLVTLDHYEGSIDKNKPFALNVSPKTILPKGTHYTNIYINFVTDQGTARITAPIKIVRF